MAGTGMAGTTAGRIGIGAGIGAGLGFNTATTGMGLTPFSNNQQQQQQQQNGKTINQWSQIWRNSN
jgi:hypothetical protein